MIKIIYKALNRGIELIAAVFYRFATQIKFLGNGVKLHGFRTSGVPYVTVAMGGSMTIGKNFAMNNGMKGNPIGCYERCTFFVNKGATIEIGDNVGISQAALISYSSIKIGDNVKIGGGAVLYTTDFHSLDASIRKTKDDLNHRVSLPIVVGDNAFIGAKSIILKGVTIGENSIVGAGSVVTKSIPANEIWAGNPAKFIKRVPSRNNDN